MHEDEFAEYVAVRWPRLVRSAMLLGCSPGEAEDLVQTALTKCLVHWSRVRQAEDRDAYVHRALTNAFASSRRRRWWGERPYAELPQTVGTQTWAADETSRVDVADAVARALSRLTPDQRAVVVLRYYAHLTEAQTASALQIARGTVKSRLSRALKVLAADETLDELRGV